MRHESLRDVLNGDCAEGSEGDFYRTVVDFFKDNLMGQCVSLMTGNLHLDSNEVVAHEVMMVFVRRG